VGVPDKIKMGALSVKEVRLSRTGIVKYIRICSSLIIGIIERHEDFAFCTYAHAIRFLNAKASTKSCILSAKNKTQVTPSRTTSFHIMPIGVSVRLCMMAILAWACR
jgi:hypothetical protein